MEERKYKLAQLTTYDKNNELISRREFHRLDCLERSGIFGMPSPNNRHHVYYTGSDAKEGTFRLVIQEGELERTVDEGTATSSHVHSGIDTLTFYGIGKRTGRNYSIHCEYKTPAKAKN